ncbi:MAG: ATP-binding cassette domain-containing protein [Clostridiales bacterium]|nr:ATP-binding cassette domain-containing protein [Roseburia sp.]MDD7638575.1 ATP-binding cassette domain-containing protein [Clostridiales bacterium]MDY4111476.1 ATP-binding cassette domain-containing protein [Roseburia sp.]
MENIIEIESLTKRYEINTEYDNLWKRLFNKEKKSICAVDDIDLAIAKGSMVALLGKNGAGKTSLIKMLTGIVTPTSGSIVAAGFNPYKDRYKYSYHIGVVLGQKSLLWHNIPAKDSLNLYRSIYDININDYEKRLGFFAGVFDVKDLLDTPVRKLSLGERMKFELIAALLHEPDLLFLDEPTIGLDILAKQQMYSFLNTVNREKGTTIIITTHNVDDVENLCDRVVLMDAGKIIYDGDRDGLCRYNQTKKIVVAGEVRLDNAIKRYLEKKEGNQYVFKCDGNDSDAIACIVDRVVPGSDITVMGMDIEDVLLNVYGGKIKL